MKMSLRFRFRSRDFIVLWVMMIGMSLKDGAWASDVTEYDVNGYRAIFVNTHNGNALTLAFTVLGGSLHDDPTKFAGLAHLWEHTIFLGSKKFPGKETFDAVAEELGLSSNAYTADDRIFYHITGHPDAFREAAELLGSMVSEPDPKEADFKAEKDVVMNEARDYSERDPVALDASILINLLPKGDPWAMYSVGNPEQLTGVTLRHLRRLFEANYQPASSAIILTGNFDKRPDGTQVHIEETLRMLRGFFAPPKVDPVLAEEFPDIRPGKDIVFPPAVKLEDLSRRGLELSSTTGERYLQVSFEVPENIGNDPFLMGLVQEYFGLKCKGSVYELVRKRGLANEVQVGSSQANNRTLMSLVFDLTKKGAARRSEIFDILFDLSHKIQKEGFWKEVRDFFVSRNLKAYESARRSSMTSANEVGRLLARRVAPDKALDAHNFEISEDSLGQAISGILDPRRMLFGYSGPEVKATEAAPQFPGRTIKILTTSNELERLQRIREQGGALTSEEVRPKILKVELQKFAKRDGATRGRSFSPRVLSKKRAGEEIILTEEPESTRGPLEGGIILKLQFPKMSARQQVALQIIVSAFKEHYSSELESLKGDFLLQGIEVNAEGIQILSQGSPDESRGALLWVLEKLKSFEPTKKEFRQAKEALRSKYLSARANSWPAILAFEAARAVTRPDLVLAEDGLKVLENDGPKALNASSVRRVLDALFLRVDKTYSFAGDYREEEARELAERVRGILPGVLRAEERAELKRPQALPKGTLRAWRSLSENRAPNTWGHAMMIEGPPPIRDGRPTPELVAFTQLESALHRGVFQTNRGAGLGYVQGARLLSGPKRSWLALYGQTEGDGERFARIEAGWRRVLGWFIDGVATVPELEAAKRGYGLSSGMIPETHLDEAAERLAGFERSGDPTYSDTLRRRVSLMSTKGALRRVSRLLREALNGSATRVEGVLSKSCGATLQSIGQVRARLRK
jgi:secreted Zn-dependent insulinase-like peptidase